MDIMYTLEYKEITESFEDKIAEIYKSAAYEYLIFYKSLLKQHNYSRHKITFFCAMGSSSVMVDGEFLHARPNWKQNAAAKLLWDIEDSLVWDWAAYLDGVSLN